jgi:hypothetical protein
MPLFRESHAMPIVEASPWRKQYFEGVACPQDLVIPTDDDLAYALHPAERWVYNKLLICDSQGLACAPHGIAPGAFPVFSKPIYNLRGMGTGTRVLRSEEDYERHLAPGHMWMELLEGEHVSTDVAMAAGAPAWFRHATGVPLGDGVFDYWMVLAEPRPLIEAHCRAWLGRHLPKYTGMVNLETIGGRIIDVHLRFTDQWPDLYGPGWIERMVALYATGEWRHPTAARRDGFSLVLTGPHARRYRPPPPERLATLTRAFGLSSLQVTFHAEKPPESHAMPPGGFRLALLNGFDLEAGRAARRALAALFAETPGN